MPQQQKVEDFYFAKFVGIKIENKVREYLASDREFDSELTDEISRFYVEFGEL